MRARRRHHTEPEPAVKCLFSDVDKFGFAPRGRALRREGSPIAAPHPHDGRYFLSMVEVICTACGTPIPAEDVNVRANVAYGRRCGIAHVLSRPAGWMPREKRSMHVWRAWTR